MVGRLPDLTGSRDPALLIGLLGSAAHAVSRPATDYTAHFAISAAVWRGSTELSIQRLFGSSAAVRLSPADGPAWTASELLPRTHFINCHGAEVDPVFDGEGGQQFPEAHRAAHVAGKITEGTVAAVECRYGAQLCDPAATGGQMGRPNLSLQRRLRLPRQQHDRRWTSG